jgi:peptidoglycan/LPS O-acetylase OafA/YrhL
VRRVAIVMVLVWHLICVPLAPARDSPLAVLVFGAAGVDLFFVLSGMLIAGILLDHRDAGSYFGPFYRRRACRIFPLYLALQASFALLAASPLASDRRCRWVSGDVLPLWSYATFTQNLVRGVLLAYLLRSPAALAATLRRRTLVVVGLVVSLAASLAIWIVPAVEPFAPLGYFAVGGGFLLLILIAVAGDGAASRWFSSPVLIYVGVRSYGIYLFAPDREWPLSRASARRPAPGWARSRHGA